MLVDFLRSIAAMSAGLGKGNNKITDQYSAYEKGLVLYYYYPILVIFGCNFLFYGA